MVDIDTTRKTDKRLFWAVQLALTNIQSPNYEDLGSGGIYGMCIDFLNGRLMAGNGSGGNFITINKDGDGKVRIRGAIVQDSAGNASPILTDRGNWVNTAMYYVGNYFNYNGSSYQCILDTLMQGHYPLIRHILNRLH